MGEREDFVKVKLTAAGEARAQGGPLRVIEGWLDETFMPGQVKDDITVLDWNKVLSRHAHNGEPMFETVDGPRSTVDGEEKSAG